MWTLQFAVGGGVGTGVGVGVGVGVGTGVGVGVGCGLGLGTLAVFDVASHCALPLEPPPLAFRRKRTSPPDEKVYRQVRERLPPPESDPPGQDDELGDPPGPWIWVRPHPPDMPAGRLAENHTSAYALPEPSTPVDWMDTLHEACACALAGRRMPKQPTTKTRRRAETRVIGTSTADCGPGLVVR